MSSIRFLCLVGVAIIMGLSAKVSGESEPNAYSPELNMKDTDGKEVSVYKGFIVTNEDTVSIVPELSASDKDEIGGARFICGYRIYSDDYDIPFQAVIATHVDGKAKLKTKPGIKLNELSRRKFKFQIAAFDCGSPTLYSEKAHVVVQVIDAMFKGTPPLPLPDFKELVEEDIQIVDHKTAGPPAPPPGSEGDVLRMEQPPVPTEDMATSVYPKLPLPDAGGEQFFERPSYIVAMREATLYDSILKLRPADGKSTANICGYEIVTDDAPFAVDELGNIRNTKSLDASVQESYIVSVVAKHCNGVVSKPALINIQVSEICSNGWKDLPTDQEYKAGSKALQPFADAWFDTCTTSCSESESAAVTVSLKSEDGDINTCEHDSFSIQRQRDSCGAAPNSVDLLPKDADWVEPLKAIEGHETAYRFDGKTAVNVPSGESNHVLSEFFTIATWMNHGDEKKDGHKEHLLCNADGDGMNRHHYSLFVHNCRLVFLLRKEASQVESLDTFQPAEWRWTLPQFCDSKWHHYALSVTYPQVKLYIDGQAVQADKSVVEVVDDWALHPTDKVTFEQLSVGGCWQGETNDFGQFFTGSLAGLTMLSGTTETERAIKCLNRCGEKLQFHAMDQLSVGMSVSFNTELTELTIRGGDVEDIRDILRRVGYTNTNGNPTAGYTRIHVKTNATCDGEPLDVNEQTIPILVSEVADPEITIAGVASKERTIGEFAEGVDVFTEIMLLSDPEKELSGQENRINKIDVEDVNKMQKDLKKRLILDKCEVRVDQKMDPVKESLRLPADLLVEYLLDTKEFDEGFDITGMESFANYEAVLRETFYYNNAAEVSSAARKFTLQCSSMGGTFVSNSFTVELRVMSDGSQAQVLYNDPQQYANIQAQGLAVEGNAIASGVQATVVSGGSSGTVAAVVVVCLAFLVGVIAVAVVRIRRVQAEKAQNPNLTIEDGPEMEWDNSTLNVTVNPFENESLMNELKTDSTAACESEDELMSSDDEDDSRKDGGLEWDNSSY
ncbi:calsyntenin-1-like [Watersipora subatra]|uniref:calsyntenin-1-like n=1 Tax=Watersipora subatra TaxID=2589382 RepID=UPI00355B0BAF